MNIKTPLGILSACLMLILTACGGSSSSSLGDGGDDRVDATGKNAGPISAFGSVFVNGTEFEIDNNTTITIDGQSKTEDDLRVGFFVLVESDIGDPVARAIDFSESVRGRVEDDPVIDNLATLSATMTVLGQTVITNAATIFDGLVLEAIRKDDTLVVSGTRRADDAIVATYVGLPSVVGLPDDTEDFQVQGPARDVRTGVGAKTLQIGELTVDFTGAETPDGNPDEGQLTKAEGTLGASGVLIATSIETDADLAPAFDDEVTLEGFITEFTSIGDFKVSAQRVDASSAKIEGGPLPADPIDTPVEVEGRIDGDGVLQARRLEIKPAVDDNDLRINALVESISLTNPSGTTGSITLLGVTLRVTVSTRLEDKSSARARPFTLNDISVGNRLETRGFQDNTGRMTAMLIERKDPEVRVLLQGTGTLNRLSNTVVKILGIPVPTTGSGTVYKRNDNPISRREFIDRIIDGVTIVKARWDLATIDPTNPPAPNELSIEEPN